MQKLKLYNGKTMPGFLGGSDLAVPAESNAKAQAIQWVADFTSNTNEKALAALRMMQARGERDDDLVDAEGGGDTAGFIGAWSVEDDGDVAPRMIIRGPATRAGGFGGVALNPKNGEVYGVGSNAVMTYLVPHFFSKPGGSKTAP